MHGDSINRIGGSRQGWSTEMVIWYFSINACQHKGDSTARNGDLTSRNVVFFPQSLVAHCLQPSLRNFGFRILNSFYDWMIIPVYSSDIFTYRICIYTYIYMCIWCIYIYIKIWLVVWNIIFIFPYIGNIIIPTDELIFFRGVETTNQICWIPILDIRQVELEHARLGHGAWGGTMNPPWEKHNFQ